MARSLSRVVLVALALGPFACREDVWEQPASTARALAEAEGERPIWEERTPSGAKPVARAGHAMAYDSGRGKVVLFGGWTDRPLGDTWEWDGVAATWTERVTSVAEAPPARAQHAMAYDSVRGKVVLGGGGGYADTWEWDGGAGTWTERMTSATKPATRRSSAMAFDASRGRMVLFGGDIPDPLQDTWEWDGATGTWTERAISGVKPPPRAGHAMAYDANRGKVILFGGPLLRDTWEWDGITGTWTERTTDGVTPPARFRHAMANDIGRGRVVVFGGSHDPHARASLRDTWEWDGTAGTWAERSPIGPTPAARDLFAMVFDERRRSVVIFGGSPGGASIPTEDFQDTWEYRITGGTRTDAGAPEPDAGSDAEASVHDAGSDRVSGGGEDRPVGTVDAPDAVDASNRPPDAPTGQPQAELAGRSGCGFATGGGAASRGATLAFTVFAFAFAGRRQRRRSTSGTVVAISRVKPAL